MTTNSTQAGTPRAITDGDTILATALVGGSPERVFRTLMTNEVETWWGSPDTYRVKHWNADLQLGGCWTLDVMVQDARHPASGVFLEIDAPHRIVFTRRYDSDPAVRAFLEIKARQWRKAAT